MSEMIDIVASALAERFAQTVSEGAEMEFAKTGVAMPAPGVWRAYAEAALEAMRVPTEKMDLAGAQAASFRSLGLQQARHIWRDMIDAALDDKS